MPKGGIRPRAKCHPKKPHWARGLCEACYYRKLYETPEQKIRIKAYRKKAWAKYRETTRRRQHSFTSEDEIRFKATTICDWCNQSLNGGLAHIDHDHRCCPIERHCAKCTRGFVHRLCNSWAISYYEWQERDFGITDPKLRDYRLRFPVPRVVSEKGSQESPVQRTNE
jgi:hypothetical protein